MEKKVCSKCKEEKEVCEFNKDKNKKDGYRYQCKICSKEWRLNNREHLLQYNREYYNSNFNTVIFHKNYYQKNKERIQKYQKYYQELNRDNINKKLKLKKQTDLIFLISCRVRNRIYKYLKSKNIIKSVKTFELIGCSKIELKHHLESLFVDGMSWKNRGEWHIDHIIPLSSAKNEEEIYKLCHYTNLQPLWVVDNLKKHSKLI